MSKRLGRDVSIADSSLVQQGLQYLRKSMEWQPGFCTATGGFSSHHSKSSDKAFNSEAGCVSIQTKQRTAAPRRATPGAGLPPAFFAGCAKDLNEHYSSSTGHGLFPAAQEIENIGAHLRDYRVMIFEDPPRDDTLSGATQRAAGKTSDPTDLGVARDPTFRMLTRWAARNHRVRLLVGNGKQRSSRTERLAFCRNVLLSEASRPNVLRQFSAFVMMDLDCTTVNRPATFSSILSSLMRRSSAWHVLTGNTPQYYDFWALQSSLLDMQYDCLLNQSAIGRYGGCFAYKVHLDPRAPPLPVDSAFNGVAIYQLGAVASTGCRYNGRAANGRQACEHVSFHKCLVGRGLRIAIMPALMTGCGLAIGRKQRSLDPKSLVSVSLSANGTLTRKRPGTKKVVLHLSV